MDPRALTAAANNADWCDLVCRAHDIGTARAEGWWFSHSTSPANHPDAVSLEPRAAQLPALVAARVPCAVKDSFGTLELSPYGFRVVLEGRWIVAAAGPGGPHDWRAVTGAEELERWRSGHGDAPAVRAELLTDPDVRVLVSADGRDGLIAHRSAAALGISNVFGTGAAWTEGVAAARDAFPGLPLVGWQRGTGLAAAVAVGFEPLGRLRVWVRGA